MSEKEPPIAEPVAAPEIFADGHVSVAIGRGVSKFTFFSLAHGSQDHPTERRIVLRLTMPLPAILALHDALGNMIESMKKDGVLLETPRP